MKVPNVRIEIKAQNGSACVREFPRYWLPMFKAAWAGRLDERDGIVVSDLDFNLPDSYRYREITDHESELRYMIDYFSHGNGPEAEGRRRQVVNAAQHAFPRGLRAEIEKVMLEDAQALRRHMSDVSAKKARTPHKSYIEAQIPHSASLALMDAGYPTFSDVPRDFMLLVEAGVPNDQAYALSEAETPQPAAVEADPLAE